jgi:hypothetical protein
MNTTKAHVGRPSELPVFEITVRVQRFHHILEPWEAGQPPLTQFTMEESCATPAKDALCLDDGDYQNRHEPSGRRGAKPSVVEDAAIEPDYKKETVHVPLPGAILRFDIARSLRDPDDYRPVGIAFSRSVRSS